MNPTELEQLLESRSTVSQFLLAHLIALYLIMRPLGCKERKVDTVTMYGIRMSNWIKTIRMQVAPDHQQALAWPLLVNQLHLAGTLEQYALTHEPQPTQSIADGCRSAVDGYLDIDRTHGKSCKNSCYSLKFGDKQYANITPRQRAMRAG